MRTFVVASALFFGVLLASSSLPIGEAAHASSAPVIVAAGDIACAPNDVTAPCQDQETAALLAGADKVIPLGDNQYNIASLPAFLSVYDHSWGQYRSNSAPGTRGTTSTRPWGPRVTSTISTEWARKRAQQVIGTRVTTATTSEHGT